jgi:hypothetical protein
MIKKIRLKIKKIKKIKKGLINILHYKRKNIFTAKCFAAKP